MNHRSENENMLLVDHGSLHYGMFSQYIRRGKYCLFALYKALNNLFFYVVLVAYYLTGELFLRFRLYESFVDISVCV